LDDTTIPVNADFKEEIENTLTLLHHEFKNRIKVVKEYGDIPDVKCRVSQMNQVFMNLLVNACQAIEGEGTITIRTLLEDGNVLVRIKDTGRGIAKENLDKVFSPGFTTKGVGVGTGLGLSICYNIIEEHDGRIYVESEINEGSQFTIELPIAG